MLKGSNKVCPWVSSKLEPSSSHERFIPLLSWVLLTAQTTLRAHTSDQQAAKKVLVVGESFIICLMRKWKGKGQLQKQEQTLKRLSTSYNNDGIIVITSHSDHKQRAESGEALFQFRAEWQNTPVSGDNIDEKLAVFFKIYWSLDILDKIWHCSFTG